MDTDLQNQIQEQMGVPPVPDVSAMGATPDGGVSAVDAMAAELTNSAPDLIAPEPAVAADDSAAVLDALVTDAPKAEETPVVGAATAPADDLAQIKKSMLKDLFPIMDKVSVSPEQRYRIYHEMIEDTGDKSLIAAAYETVKTIADEGLRAEALLFLVEQADK